MFHQNQDPRFFKESNKTVDTFITRFASFEAPIKQFFMNDIDQLLETYDPGKPEMKPDVLKQIKEIEAKRDKMIEDAKAAQNSNSSIILQREGQEPLKLTSEQVVNIVTQLQTANAELTQTNEQNKRLIELLQKKIIDLNQGNTQSIDSEQCKNLIIQNQKLQNNNIENAKEISVLKNKISQLEQRDTFVKQPGDSEIIITKGTPEIIVDISDI